MRGNLAAVLDPENGLTYYGYDSASRMTSVRNPWDEMTYYEYTPGGRLLARTLGNDTIAYHEYDAAGRTSKVDNRKSDMSAICSFTYERDAGGNPVSIEREDGYVVYYGYDAKSQLTSETHRDGGDQPYAWQWDYDAAGNREYQVLNSEATYYEYDAANELTREYTAATDTYYQYDGSGNTVAKQEASGTTYYQYDFENLMTRIDFEDDSHNYFGYDADSKRVEKRDSAGYARFVYQGPDMLKLLQEQDADGDAVVQYTMGGALEAMRRANGGGLSGGATSFYHFDWLGSTFALTDATAAATDTYCYDAWGEVLNRTGTLINPHTYIGKERYYRMPNASLYHLGFRDYAAGVGRFVTVDPKRDGTNWFRYAGSAPSCAVDSLGLAAGGYPPDLPDEYSVWPCSRLHEFQWWHEIDSNLRDTDPCPKFSFLHGKLRALARCIVYAESKDNPKEHGAADDLGLFQLVPTWWGGRWSEKTGTCIWDTWANPQLNIRVGIHIMCAYLNQEGWTNPRKALDEPWTSLHDLQWPRINWCMWCFGWCFYDVGTDGRGGDWNPCDPVDFDVY